MTQPSIARLVEQMELRAKVAQLGTVRVGDLLEDRGFSRERAREVILHGVGRVTRIGRSPTRPYASDHHNL